MSADALTLKNKHVEYYKNVRQQQNKGRIAAPGMQYLVHLFRGGYLGEDMKQGNGRKLLDVGCGSGFNAVTMAMLGWQVSGCEIHEDVLRHCRDTITDYGYDIDLDLGENEGLPYADSTFDLLLSMNVIHYVQSIEAVERSLEEYARVMKPGARLVMQTIAPGNWLVGDALPVRGNLMRVVDSEDYRHQETLFVFRDESELYDCCEPFFTMIQTGQNRTDFFSRVLMHYIVTAVKKH